ncbi:MULTISPECIES: hypothetical protein [unclassified Streptomyces]|uniref:hypothetical protein n=1 Tax=unclassified Streptomyces TaxID=2593676 RepID=UPI002DD8F373|nr:MULTISPECIES: hypothetical protein [unclassified Streptomyces]WSA93186.1 hypothetical protein OIE63_17575 [Streptomyces sp. NBC_01795]WSS14177.1 hypothetical protein OG533_21550 [Streptomyces sp. NBC_01186]WSS42998.1 hypothetical protein OG220_22240 [Streptomyces sp. NBC_01187]
MPTPCGSRGGVAFSADELRVLGGALAIALQSDPAPERSREYLRLARSVEEAAREGDRLRAFLLADLARYREALPGAATGYLDQLEGALTAGHLPRPDDLAALRSLCAEAAGERESARRRALLHRCESLAERAVRAGPRIVPRGRRPWDESPPAPVAAEEADEPDREAEPGNKPGPGRPAPARPGPAPSRPVPTPAEVFPPRRPSPQPPQGPEAPDSPPAGPDPETERPGTEESAKRRDPVPV